MKEFHLSNVWNCENSSKLIKNLMFQKEFLEDLFRIQNSRIEHLSIVYFSNEVREKQQSIDAKKHTRFRCAFSFWLLFCLRLGRYQVHSNPRLAP